jgi:hypothetical protein
MHLNYFPRCPIDGPIEPPTPYGHLVFHGAVPKKCSECCELFEGSCTRYMDDLGHYFELDHGSCGIPGPTEPVAYANESMGSEVEIPRKCVSCSFLKFDGVHGLVCNKDHETWGDFYRGFDWGDWEPDFIFVQLPEPKRTNKQLVLHAHNADLIEFIKEYRRINPGLSLQEARSDFQGVREILAKWSQKK